MAATDLVGNLSNGGHLLGSQDAAGNPHAQHVVARRRLAMEESVPLESLEVLSRNLRILARRSHRGIALDVGQDVEAILGRLQHFDLVHRHGQLLSKPSYAS